ncbi:MAG: 50S ribosomal protein L21 [Bacteroidetes bacterium]|nr:MAG: 50S ribosomal protein L21 [Bacteroidota bacterium]
MYAIVEIAGKQYKVRQQERLYVPRLDHAAPDDRVTFDRVLLVSTDDGVTIGTPTVDGAAVSATVLGHVKADKVLVFKKKRRKRFKVKRGHRQPYTQIRIDAIDANGAAPAATEADDANADEANA